MHDYSLMISTLKAGDLSTNAIAGIIGNVSHESGGNIFALEGYGGKKTTDEATYSSLKMVSHMTMEIQNQAPISIKMVEKLEG